MKGICRLCQQERELRESHLIPAFAIRWMKDTGSGYLRLTADPNRRKQDGPKYRWLCGECELKFSVWEDFFAQSIFHPYIKDENASLKYDKRLFFFSISLLWRALIRSLDYPDASNRWFYSLMVDAELKWRRYLTGETQDPVYSSVQLFFSGISNNPTIPAKHFNSYLARAIDSTVGFSKDECFIYAKFSRFLFFGYLTKCDQSKWIGTQVASEGGTIGPPQAIEDGAVGDFLVSRPREAFKEFEGAINEKSKDAMIRHFSKIRDKIIGSDQWKAQMKDHFSPVAYGMPNDGISKPGRNDPCPCGSGKKFKKCHGAMI